MRTAFVLVALLAAGCLPKSAVGRRHEIEADRFSVSVSVKTETVGLDVSPFTWRLQGMFLRTFAREFRDGSQGWLYLGDSVRAAVEHDGVDTAVLSNLDSLAVELRSFPDGEILAITGDSAHFGIGGHAEVLDVLWPAFSPHLPSGPGPTFAPFGTTWPTWLPGGPRLQARLVSTWTRGESWTWTGTASGADGPVRFTSTGRGTLETGGEERVIAHTTHWDRTVLTDWPGGRVQQVQTVDVAVQHLGTEPSPGVERPPPSESRGSDLEPLRLTDGRRIEDVPVEPASVLPFLLLPDDLPAERLGALRASLFQAGTIPSKEPSP